RYDLRQAIVVRVPERVDRGLDAAGVKAHVRRAVGYFAAPPVAQLIGPATALGLAGGRTLAELVGYLAPGSGKPPAAGLTVLPLMGNIGPTASDIDAADLSRRVARTFGGAGYTLNAPAIAQDGAARDHFLAHEHIRTVRQLFDSLTLALVGVGSLDESAFIERGILTNAELAALRAAGAVGEICGRFFDAAGRECRSGYRERVIGIELETLRQATQKGADVLVVTNGSARSPALRAAVAGGLVNGLVIDDAGARALLT
ncbi:MAG TPA: sugar-binding domain-containing protein, partial [Chloroflexota bacterium]|nr:sugar-binding domain-containing protein [Chloroflexota bacterium]